MKDFATIVALSFAACVLAGLLGAAVMHLLRRRSLRYQLDHGGPAPGGRRDRNGPDQRMADVPLPARLVGDLDRAGNCRSARRPRRLAGDATGCPWIRRARRGRGTPGEGLDLSRSACAAWRGVEQIPRELASVVADLDATVARSPKPGRDSRPPRTLVVSSSASCPTTFGRHWRECGLSWRD